MDYLFVPPAVTLRNSAVCPQSTNCHHSFIHSVFCLTTGPKPPPKDSST